MSDEVDPIEAVIKDFYKRIERIEQNIDYARFDIQEQRINVQQKDIKNLQIEISGRTDQMEDWSERTDKRISSLEASSARQTEKIPIGNDLLKRIKSKTSIPMDKSKYEKPPEPICDDCIYKENYKLNYEEPREDEPKPGEHFIMRDDNTPNNPILRALFFGGDEEYIVDWKFRYKREYYDIVKREDLQWLVENTTILLTKKELENYTRIEEEYNL